MSVSCVYTPTVKVGNEEKNSELFQDLVKFFGNREQAIDIYSFTQTPLFKDRFVPLGIKMDALGEPTIESLRKTLFLDELANPDTALLSKEIDLGAKDSKGNVIYYKNPNGIIGRVIAFNEDNPTLVASVTRVDEGYKISVSKLSEQNVELKSKLVYANELNKRLIAMVNALGFDIKVDSNLFEDGMFNPLNAETNANGLLEVITLADNESGTLALPEEVAHLFVEGLSGTAGISRLIGIITKNEIARDILGEQYSNYAQKYGNDSLKLAHEAAAHLLMEYFSGNQSLENVKVTPNTKESLVRRLYYIFRDLLDRFRGKKDALYEAKRQAGIAAKEVLDGEGVKKVDVNKIKMSPTFYRVAENIRDYKKILEDALKLMTRDLSIQGETVFSYSTGSDADRLNAFAERTRQVSQSLKNYETEKETNPEYITFGLTSFVETAAARLTEIVEALNNLEDKPMNTLYQVNTAAKAYNDILKFGKSYLNALNTISSLSKVEAAKLGITPRSLEVLSNSAAVIVREFNDNARQFDKYKFRIIKQLFRLVLDQDLDKALYVRKDKKGNIVPYTIDMILAEAERDISHTDKWLASFADTSDTLLSLIAKVIKTIKDTGDMQLNDEIIPEIIAANNALRKAGVTSTAFMLETYELEGVNGKKYTTTKIISDIDWLKYNNAMLKEFKKIDDRKISKSRKVELKKIWIEENNDLDYENHEYTPKLYNKDGKPLYIKDEGKRIKDTLNEAQYAYYQKMMSEGDPENGIEPGLKRRMDKLLPASSRRTFRPIYMRDDLTEILLDATKNGKTKAKEIWGNIQDMFIRRRDEDTFGNQIAREKVDIDESVRETLPIYFTTPLEDRTRLTKDFTSAMIAYSAMCVNFASLDQGLEALELARTVVKERKVVTKNGNVVVTAFEKMVGFKGKTKTVSQEDAKEHNRIAATIDAQYASIIYGKRRKDEGTVFGTKIDKAKLLDFIKYYVTLSGLGLNLFSGISNAVMGKFQFFLEQIAGEFFNAKNGSIAKGRYWYLVWPYLAEYSSTNKMSTLGLLINKFDALDDYHASLRKRGYYNNNVGRVCDVDLVLFNQTAGEHYLHCITMLAILDAQKCKIIDPKTGQYVKDANGKDKVVSLFDAFEKDFITDEDGERLAARLKIKDNYVRENGRKIDDEYIIKVKNMIHEVNGKMHGKFNSDDRGVANQYGYLRLLMQFRQWMVAHYQRRFASPRYNANLEYDTEGFYVTMFKFTGEIMKSLAKRSFALGAIKDGYTTHQKANLVRGLTELLAFVALGIGITAAGGAKDKKGKWMARAALYTALRLKAEVGASIPWVSMYDNALTLLQSPMAALSKVDSLFDLLCFWDIWREVESGKYKGMSVYRRNALKTLPFIGAINRAIDVANEDYMFATFETTNSRFRKN